MGGKETNRPIGVFDSGVGGLTVLRALAERMPGQDIVYFGDTARVPYGTKSRETVVRFSRRIVRFLLDHGVRLIVCACNTASALAVEEITGESAVPLVGVIDAGVEAALRNPGVERIAVIGTRSTVESRTYESRIKALAPDISVFSRACPLFVPLVEEGLVDHPITRTTIEYYLDDLRRAKVDTVLLGCTHYPLLIPEISRFFGEGVRVVDSATSVAEQVISRFGHRGDITPENGKITFYLSDESQFFRKLAESFLGFEPQPVLYDWEN